MTICAVQHMATCSAELKRQPQSTSFFIRFIPSLSATPYICALQGWNMGQTHVIQHITHHGKSSKLSHSSLPIQPTCIDTPHILSLAAAKLRTECHQHQNYCTVLH